MAKGTHTSMRTVTLEAGHPTTMQALVRMNQALSSARTNVGVLKLIHGYGSSGKGGAIRQAVLGAQVRIPVHKALGRVCAMPTVSCPPAIPVAVSGEEITPAAIVLMQRYGIEELSVLR